MSDHYLSQTFEWNGREDPEDPATRRWYQQVDLDGPKKDQPALIGFASDEGVRRNQGRMGAREGPEAIRKALCNLTCSSDFAFSDLGDIRCDDENLERAQMQLGEVISDVLNRGAQAIVLGGGHEVAFGSYLGVVRKLEEIESQVGRAPELGIINFDAHFDLRNPSPLPSSGTPFRQIHQDCLKRQWPFHYFVLGVNPSVNGDALFNYATEAEVKWAIDRVLTAEKLEKVKAHLETFIKRLDVLYLSICLDVFPAAYAPGVSAPAAIGVEPQNVLSLMEFIRMICRHNNVDIAVFDIAEMNPIFDRDGQTAKLAARLVYEYLN